MSEKMTIQKIAKLANTSKTTVSFYLNGKTERMSKQTMERIKTIIDETGYRPSAVARSLSNQHSKLIGVIIGDIVNGFSNQVVKGIDDVMKQAQYQLILGNSNYLFDNEEEYLKSMLSMGVEGLIVQPTVTFKNHMDQVGFQSCPLVFIDSQANLDNEYCVKTNHYQASFQAIHACLQKGYRHVFSISADPQVLQTRLERIEGAQNACEQMEAEHHLIVVDHDATVDEIGRRLREAIPTDERSLVFVVNSWMLPNVHQAMKKNESLDYSQCGLIGFDNLEWTSFVQPTVTTIVQPAYEEGRVAAQTLLDILQEKAINDPCQTLTCEVQWGESTI